MALKQFPLEYCVILCHAGHAGCHIIMYYAPEKCFRAIWGHAGTFWVMIGHDGTFWVMKALH